MWKFMGLVAVLSACGDDGGTAAADAPVSCPAPSVVYIHKDGGTYTKTPLGTFGNSSANTSPLLDTDSFTFTPLASVTDAYLEQIRMCLATKLGSFNIEVTTTDPGDAVHREMLFVSQAELDAATGATGAIGLSEDVCASGARPAAETYARGVAFVTDPTMEGGPDLANACWTVGQSAGFMFALDVEHDCRDLTSFSSGTESCLPANKTFVDEDFACGPTSVRDCRCGGTKQNSYQVLLANAGPHCGD